MSANINPIFVGTPNTSWSGSIATANIAVDGTGSVATAFTAGANGSYVRRLRAKAGGTCVASVLRVFLNNGAPNATAGNNALVAEINLPATTASNSVAVGNDIEYPLNMVLPAGYLINCAIGTTVVGGWNVTIEGGNF
jgi:hypothetical protein